MIYTVFPNSLYWSPKDFETYEEAVEYGEELKKEENIDYKIGVMEEDDIECTMID